MWETKDLQDLKAAVQWLEHPGWAIRLINFLGAPIEALIRVLPRPLSLRKPGITRCGPRWPGW